MNESLGSLELEYFINNPDLLRQMAESEKIVQEATGNIEVSFDKAGNALAKMKANGGFSDSAAEVEAYAESLRGVGDSGRVAISGTDELVRLLTKDLEAGTITAQEFKAELEAINERQQAAAAAAIEAAATVAQTEREELGRLEQLKASLKELQASRLKMSSVLDIESANVEIAATTAEIKRLESLGVQAFTAIGKAVEKPTGQIARMQYAAKLYQQQITTATNPDIITKYNAKLEQTQAEITRLKNMGRQGFDELGNAIQRTTSPMDRIGAAFSRVTDIGNIGARAITNLSRQIIGLGTAMLGAFIGAKAIESIISLFKQMIAYGDRLNVAKANLANFNSVMADANKQAAPQIENFKQLYDAATNVNLAMKDRIAAAEELRRQAPEEFANASAMSIANGHLKSSYDELTAAIIATARAKAAQDKISELAAKQLDLDVKRDKINYKKASEIAGIKGTDYATGEAASEGFASTLGDRTVEQQKADAKRRADQAQTEVKAEREALQKQIDYLSGYVSTVSDQGVALGKANKLLGDQLQNFNNLVSKAGSYTDYDNIKKALEVKLHALAPDDAQFKAIQDKIRAVEEIEKKYQPKTTDGKAEANADAAALQRRLSLLNEIGNAVTTVNRKGLDSDQAALKAISDKFDALRKKIVQFNSDPKNKNHQISIETFSMLNTAQTDAETNQNTENQTKHLQEQIELYKKRYADYEAYRAKVGDDIANKDYADLLKSGKNFEEFLTNMMAYVGNDGSEAMKSRSIMIQKFVTDLEAATKQQLGNYLADTLSFNDRYLLVISQTQAKVKALRDAAAKTDDADQKARYEEAARREEQQGANRLTQLNLQQQQELESYRGFADAIANLSATQAKLRIKDAEQAALSAKNQGKITSEIYKQIIDLIDQADKKIASNELVHDLDAIATAFDGIANSAGGLSDGLKDTFTTISNFTKDAASIIKGIGDLETAVKNYSEKKKEATSSTGSSFLGSVSAAVGMIPVVGQFVGAAISVVSGVINAFKAAKQSAIEAAKQMVAYQNSLITGQITYNELLRDQARTQGDITAMTTAELNAREKLLQMQQSQAQADYNTLLNLIQSQGEQITGEHTEKYGGFLGFAKKTRVVQDTAGIGGLDYDALLKLYTEGKLTDTTKSWFEQLQKVHDEFSTIDDDTKQVTDQLNQVLTGTTADSISKAIIQGFQNGKRTAADFADDFKSMMQNAALSVFEANYLQGKIADFYQLFADASNSDGGLTADKIASLQAAYNKVINDAGAKLTDLEKVLGTSLTSGSTDSNSLVGAIKGITSEEAGVLEGTTRAMQMLLAKSTALIEADGVTQASQLAEMRNQTLQLMQIATNTKRSADTLDNGVVPALNAIKNNTGDTSNTLLRAQGFYKWV